MEVPKRLLITNCYSYQNKGDAAIITCMIDQLKREFPRAKLTISSHDKKDLLKKPYGNHEYIQNIQTIVFGNSKNIILKGFKAASFIARVALFRILPFKSFFLFNKAEIEKLRSYEKSDLVVACGGGYLLTTRKFDILGAILFAHDFYLATLFSKPIVLYNQSIGPFGSRFHLPLLKMFLKPAKIILCREAITYHRLEKEGLKNIVLAADVAFLLKPKKEEFAELRINALNIGISVRKWVNPKRQKKYENEIRKFIEMTVQKNPEAVFYFMPQVIYDVNDDNDLPITRSIIAGLSSKIKKNAINIERDLNPSVLMHYISQMDFFIGTRMHSNIFALACGVKTIAIAYEPKSLGVMNGLGLQEYVIGMWELTAAELQKKFDKLREDSSYLRILKNSLRQQKALAKVVLKKYINA
ncbi:MAG: polysaccharide pyruvyl transferase family protein [Nanoarchaeota archaeon]